MFESSHDKHFIALFTGLRNICQTAVTPSLNTKSQNAILHILGVLQFFTENIFAGTQWY